MPKQLPTINYTDLKNWFEENRKELKSLPRSVIVNEREFQIRNQSLDPLKDLYEARGDKEAVSILSSLPTNAGRKQPSVGEVRTSKVGLKGKIVISAGILGVKDGGLVEVLYDKESITITKKK